MAKICGGSASQRHGSGYLRGMRNNVPHGPANGLGYGMIFLALCLSLTSAGQYGVLDQGFNPVDDGIYGDGFESYDGNPFGQAPMVWAVLAMPSGNLIVGGTHWHYRSQLRPRFVGLLPDGRVDEDFVTGTDVGVPQYLLPLADGRLLVSGALFNYQGQPVSSPMRIWPDGTLDPTFSAGTGANGAVHTMVELADGSVILAGDFTAVNGVPRPRLAKLDANGGLIQGFPADGTPDGTVRDMAITATGDILLAGEFTTMGIHTLPFLAMVDMNGAVQPFLSAEDGPDGPVRAVHTTPDGSIVIAGAFSAMGTSPQSGIAKLLPTGTPDPSFTSGLPLGAGVTHIQATPEGHIWYARTLDPGLPTSRSRVGRMDGSGNMLHELGNLNSMVSCMDLIPDGRLVVGGSFVWVQDRVRPCLAVFLPNGLLDPGFNPSRGPNALPLALAQHTDDKVLIAGEFITYNDTPAVRIARLLPSGALDTTFQVGSGPDRPVEGLAVLGDGRIFIHGTFNTYNGTPRTKLARLLADGTLDPTFNAGTGPNGVIASIVPLADGGCIVVGLFTTFNGSICGSIAKLLPNGALDTQFAAQGGASSSLGGCTLDAQGRIIIAGSFTQYGNTPIRHVARLFPNGTLDTTFDPGNGFGITPWAAMPMAVQADGSIIMAGGVADYQGGGGSGVVRILPNGDRDTSFMPGSGANGLVTAMHLFQDGRILLAGHLTAFDDVALQHVARLLPNGTLDPTFNVGQGPTGPFTGRIATALLDSDENILIGGSFTAFAGITKHRLARIVAGGGVGMADRGARPALFAWPNPASTTLEFSQPSSGTLYTSQGQVVQHLTHVRSIAVHNLPPGAYLFQSSTHGAVRFVVEH